MKIRTGFVSNSSSSSFIILFPKNFKVQDMEKYLNININIFNNITDFNVASIINNIKEDYEHFNKKDLKEKEEEFILNINSLLYTIVYFHNLSIKGGIFIDNSISDILMNNLLIHISKDNSIIFENKLKECKLLEFNDNEKLNVLISELANNYFEWFKEYYSEYNYCIFDYSDDSSFGSLMEQGDQFKNVPFIYINHH